MTDWVDTVFAERRHVPILVPDTPHEAAAPPVPGEPQGDET